MPGNNTMTTGPEFLKDLEAAGLTQAAFVRLVERLTGHRLGSMTVSRWVNGSRTVNPLAVAALKLYARLPPGVRRHLSK